MSEQSQVPESYVQEDLAYEMAIVENRIRDEATRYESLGFIGVAEATRQTIDDELGVVASVYYCAQALGETFNDVPSWSVPVPSAEEKTRRREEEVEWAAEKAKLERKLAPRIAHKIDWLNEFDEGEPLDKNCAVYGWLNNDGGIVPGYGSVEREVIDEMFTRYGGKEPSWHGRFDRSPIIGIETYPITIEGQDFFFSQVFVAKGFMGRYNRDEQDYALLLTRTIPEAYQALGLAVPVESE